MIPQEWYVTKVGAYWRLDPNNDEFTWHVFKSDATPEARRFGTVQGQIIDQPGWYWYKAIQVVHFSAMNGPFDTEIAAMEACATDKTFL